MTYTIVSMAPGERRHHAQENFVSRRMAYSPPLINTNPLVSTPAHEWASKTTSALEHSRSTGPVMEGAQNGGEAAPQMTSHTHNEFDLSEPKLPGAYPEEDNDEANLTLADAKNELVGQLHGLTQFFPPPQAAEEQLNKVYEVVRHYLPDSVSQYLPEPPAQVAKDADFARGDLQDTPGGPSPDSNILGKDLLEEQSSDTEREDRPFQQQGTSPTLEDMEGSSTPVSSSASRDQAPSSQYAMHEDYVEITEVARNTTDSSPSSEVGHTTSAEERQDIIHSPVDAQGFTPSNDTSEISDGHYGNPPPPNTPDVLQLPKSPETSTYDQTERHQEARNYAVMHGEDNMSSPEALSLPPPIGTQNIALLNPIDVIPNTDWNPQLRKQNVTSTPQNPEADPAGYTKSNAAQDNSLNGTPAQNESPQSTEQQSSKAPDLPPRKPESQIQAATQNPSDPSQHPDVSQREGAAILAPQINLTPRTHPLGKEGSKWKGVPLGEKYQTALDANEERSLNIGARRRTERMAGSQGYNSKDEVERPAGAEDVHAQGIRLSSGATGGGSEDVQPPAGGDIDSTSSKGSLMSRLKRKLGKGEGHA